MLGSNQWNVILIPLKQNPESRYMIFKEFAGEQIAWKELALTTPLFFDQHVHL